MRCQSRERFGPNIVDPDGVWRGLGAGHFHGDLLAIRRPYGIGIRAVLRRLHPVRSASVEKRQGGVVVSTDIREGPSCRQTRLHSALVFPHCAVDEADLFAGETTGALVELPRIDCPVFAPVDQPPVHVAEDVHRGKLECRSIRPAHGCNGQAWPLRSKGAKHDVLAIGQDERAEDGRLAPRRIDADDLPWYRSRRIDSPDRVSHGVHESSIDAPTGALPVIGSNEDAKGSASGGHARYAPVLANEGNPAAVLGKLEVHRTLGWRKSRRLQLVQPSRVHHRRLRAGGHISDHSAVGRDRDRGAGARHDLLALGNIQLEANRLRRLDARQLRPSDDRPNRAQRGNAKRGRDERARPRPRCADRDAPSAALRLKRVRELARRGEAVGGKLLERVPNCGVHVRRHRTPQHGERTRLLGHQLCDDTLCGRRGMRWLSSQHLVRHRAHGIDVGAPVDRPVSSCLLGAHVLRRAERQSGLRDARATGVGDC